MVFEAFKYIAHLTVERFVFPRKVVLWPLEKIKGAQPSHMGLTLLLSDRCSPWCKRTTVEGRGSVYFCLLRSCERQEENKSRVASLCYLTSELCLSRG